MKLNKSKLREIYTSNDWERALTVIELWKREITIDFPKNIDLDSVEKIEKLSHKYEIKSRTTALHLPALDCSIVCMNIYSYIVYISKHSPINKTIHTTDYLHLYVLEAIRLLQYGSQCKDTECEYSTELMILLLRQVEVMVKSREIVKQLKADLISRPEEITFEDGTFRFSKEDVHFINQFGNNFSGKGMRLRMASDTTYFMMETENKSTLLTFLRNLLNGALTEESVNFVKGTYFEFFPKMDSKDEEFGSYEVFLTDFINRIEFTTNFVKNLENKYGDIFKTEIIEEIMIPKEMIYTPQFKRWKIEEEEDKIGLFQTPIININDKYYITCFALCGDSMNDWIERELNRDYLNFKWKQVILHQIEIQFEQEVNQFMRENGYRSGSLSQNGIWNLKPYETDNYELSIRVSGECDVLAINEREKKIFLIECKRLHDIVSSGYSYKTLESNKKKILQKFIPKLTKKKRELEEYFHKIYPDFEYCCAVVTDVNFAIYFPIDVEYKLENEIIYCNFDVLKESILSNRLPESSIFKRVKQI